MVALEKSSLNLSEIEMVKQTLADPENPSKYRYCMDKFIAIRDREMVKNIYSVVKTLDSATENVVFVGYLHMFGLIKGLQEMANSNPERPLT